MKVSTIKSSWLTKGGCRLDCSPYLGGAIETEILLEELPVRKDTLGSLTSTIFNGPQFVRNYVDDPVYGVPFMTGSTMLQADLSDLPLLSKRDAHNSKLSHLQLQPGMTLISCSGSIGKMAYARPGMRGIWASQDILKVVADENRIPPGYLYAFLSSKFGVPLITSGTYGAIIQHLEPAHITGLSVPRFSDTIEQEIHHLIEDAAAGFDSFQSKVANATQTLLEEAGLEVITRAEWNSSDKRFGWAQHGIRSLSLRSLNYDVRIQPIFDQIRRGNHSSLGELCEPEFFRGKTIFTRIDSSDEFGVRLVGQREAFRIWPEGRIISRKSIEGLGLMVPPGTTLIPSHGTLGEFELYCKAVYATERTSSYAFSGDFFRCVPKTSSIHPGYLFAFLRSQIAFRMLRSLSTGGKQQEQNLTLMHEMPIPRLALNREEVIGKLIEQAASDFDQALNDEEKARSLVERNIIQCPV